MIAGTTGTIRPRATTSGTETTSRRFPAPSAIWETGSARAITRRSTRARASSAASAVKSAISSTCRSRSRSSTAISSAEPASAALRRKASVRAIWRPPIHWAARNMPSARSRYPSRWACPTNTRCEAMSSRDFGTMYWDGCHRRHRPGLHLLPRLHRFRGHLEIAVRTPGGRLCHPRREGVLRPDTSHQLQRWNQLLMTRISPLSLRLLVPLPWLPSFLPARRRPPLTPRPHPWSSPSSTCRLSSGIRRRRLARARPSTSRPRPSRPISPSRKTP